MALRVRQHLNNYFLLSVSLICVMALFAAPGLALAQTKSFTWDRFDVDIQINQDGTFRVCEKNDITFDRGSFTNGYRNIPLNRVTDLTDWSVSDGSGRQYTSGKGSYRFTVESQGNEKVINWYFPAMSGGKSETYTLCYTVHGGLWWYDQKEVGDQLVWKAVYKDRPFPVKESHVTVTLPPPATVMEAMAFLDAKAAGSGVAISKSNAPSGARVEYVLNDPLAAGHEMEVAVQFPHGVVNFAKPPWQSAEDARLYSKAAATATAEAKAGTPSSPLAGGALSSGKSGGLGGDQSGSDAGGPGNNGNPTTNLFLIALLLLGVASIVAGSVLYWYKRMRKPPLPPVADYLTEPPAHLKPYQAGLLMDQRLDGRDLLSVIVDLAQRGALSLTAPAEGKGEIIVRRERKDVEVDGVEQLVLDKFVKKDAYSLPALAEAMRQQGRTIVRMINSALAEKYLVKSDHSISQGNWLTEGGQRTNEECRAFKRYLTNIQDYPEFDAQKSIWDRYLPWAIAFGTAQEYINAAGVEGALNPAWFFAGHQEYKERRPERDWFFGPFNLPNLGGGTRAPSAPSMSSPSSGASLPNFDLGDSSRSLGSGLGSASNQMAMSLNTAAAGMVRSPVTLSDAGLEKVAVTPLGSGSPAGGSHMGDIDAGDVAMVALKVTFAILSIALGGKGGFGGGGGGGGFR